MTATGLQKVSFNIRTHLLPMKLRDMYGLLGRQEQMSIHPREISENSFQPKTNLNKSNPTPVQPSGPMSALRLFKETCASPKDPMPAWVILYHCSVCRQLYPRSSHHFQQLFTVLYDLGRGLLNFITICALYISWDFFLTLISFLSPGGFVSIWGKQLHNICLQTTNLSVFKKKHNTHAHITQTFILQT